VVDHTGRSYAFRHALTRDAVYEDMLPGERGGLHAAYGEALTRDPDLAGDAAAVPAALAHHWYAALDLPRALPASGSVIAPGLAALLGGSGALVVVGGTVLAYALLVMRGTDHAAAAVPVSQPAMADAVPALGSAAK